MAPKKSMNALETIKINVQGTQHFTALTFDSFLSCAGGLREYDLFAICLDEDKCVTQVEYVFHSPVDADVAMFTFLGGGNF